MQYEAPEQSGAFFMVHPGIAGRLDGEASKHGHPFDSLEVGWSLHTGLLAHNRFRDAVVARDHFCSRR